MAQLSNWLPWVSLVAGLSGSLHCIGMCGGLVTASCQKSQDIYRYQFGRLLGYLALGLLSGLLGNVFHLNVVHPLFSIVPSLLIGALFIYWGVKNYQGKKSPLTTPKFMGQFYTKLWTKMVHKNNNFSRAFFTGLISIFLPCGLLYGIVLGTLALEHTHEALISMFFFWLGTVPGMVLAPAIIQKILKPFKSSLPKTYAIGLIALGILTISLRMVKFQHIQEHHNSASTELESTCH